MAGIPDTRSDVGAGVASTGRTAIAFLYSSRQCGECGKDLTMAASNEGATG